MTAAATTIATIQALRRTIDPDPSLPRPVI
jgi:hypothetical protein